MYKLIVLTRQFDPARQGKTSVLLTPFESARLVLQSSKWVPFVAQLNDINQSDDEYFELPEQWAGDLYMPTLRYRLHRPSKPYHLLSYCVRRQMEFCYYAINTTYNLDALTASYLVADKLRAVLQEMLT